MSLEEVVLYLEEASQHHRLKKVDKAMQLRNRLYFLNNTNKKQQQAVHLQEIPPHSSTLEIQVLFFRVEHPPRL